MKAASEEVTGALQSAGQKPSPEGNAIYLDQMQLNDLPVLGVLPMLPLSHITSNDAQHILYYILDIMLTPQQSDS